MGLGYCTYKGLGHYTYKGLGYCTYKGPGYCTYKSLGHFIYLLVILVICILFRADEEAAGRAKAEKEKRELATQLQETQDDLDSEKEARLKTEKMRKQLDEVRSCLSDRQTDRQTDRET